MTTRIVFGLGAIAIVAVALVNLLAPVVAPTDGEIAARGVAAMAAASAAQAEAAARAAEVSARAAEAPVREGAVTALLVAGAAALSLAALAGSAAWARWSWQRAGVMLVEPVDASGRAYPAIVRAGAVTVLPAPAMATRSRVEVIAPAEAAGLLPAPDLLPTRVEIGTWAGGRELALPVGMSAAGPVAIPMSGWALGLAAGLPGMGKTSLLQAMLMGLLRGDGSGRRVQIAIIDVKRADFSGLRNQAVLWAPVARDIEAAGRLLAALRVEMDGRFAELERQGVDSWESARLAPIVLIADELAVLATDADLNRDLLYLGRLGRAAGVRVIAATQRPSSRVIPSDLRALADWTVAFSVRSQADSRVILDCGGAERLPRQPGRALLRRDDLSEVQCYYPGDWGAFVRGLPGSSVVEPVVEPVLPVLEGGFPQTNRLLAREPVVEVGPRLEWNQAPAEDVAAAMRAAHVAGDSLNAICRRWYGGKNGAAFEHVRRAVFG